MSMSLATATHPEAFCKAIVDIIQWNENAPKNILIMSVLMLIAIVAIKFGSYIKNREFDKKTKKLIVFGVSYGIAIAFVIFIINIA